MAVVPTGNKEILRLIEAFGLDISKVCDFTLIIKPDEVVTIEATMYPSEEEIEKGAIAWEAVAKKYELVEKEVEEGKEFDSFFNKGKQMKK